MEGWRCHAHVEDTVPIEDRMSVYSDGEAAGVGIVSFAVCEVSSHSLCGGSLEILRSFKSANIRQALHRCRRCQNVPGGYSMPSYRRRHNGQAGWDGFAAPLLVPVCSACQYLLQCLSMLARTRELLTVGSLMLLRSLSGVSRVRGVAVRGGDAVSLTTKSCDNGAELYEDMKSCR
jgi:hypothetical protein